MDLQIDDILNYYQQRISGLDHDLALANAQIIALSKQVQELQSNGDSE